MPVNRLPIIGAVSGYEFDVFVSYSRRGAAPKWLLNNFYPKFVDCLIDYVSPLPKVFLDKDIPVGGHWPKELQHALRHSKILIPILSAPYFESPWCMAELRSMQAREKMLGLTTLDRPQGLILPILYSDSENYAQEKELFRSWRNFKDYGTSEPVFQISPDWVVFHGKVRQFAEEVGRLLKDVPDWQPDWPLIKAPTPLLLPDPALPRF